ncbi:MAG: AAA family ATPase [Thermodesulfobacteriota bacterium]
MDQQRPALVGRSEELALMLAALACGRAVLIEGPVGVGKTRLAEEACARLGRAVVRVDGDERYGEEKLTGWYDPPAVMQGGYGEAAFRPGPLFRAMAEGAVLFVNELNRLPEGVQNVLLPALDEGRLEIPRREPLMAAPGFLVVATQNPREFVGTALLGEALRDRFELMELGYQDFAEEEEIVRRITGVDDDLIVRQAVFIARSTRSHPRVRRGASVRAAASIAAIAHRLGGGDQALAQAARLALPTRIELNDELDDNGGSAAFADFLEDLLKKKP